MTDPDPTGQPAAEPDRIWVISDVHPDGSYRTTIQFDQDTVLPLGAGHARRYAAAVVRYAAYAEHDAAVVRQMHGKLGLPLAEAAAVVAELRQQRAGEPPANDTAPLALEPGVSGRTGNAFLVVRVKGKVISQWTPDDARQHAVHVLDVLAGVDLDTAYYRYLHTNVGLGEPQARAAVGDLINFRK
jgi:hypothetical protein